MLSTQYSNTDTRQISCVEWLHPPKILGAKASKSDTEKRVEIFREFAYYVFDSLVIPLIGSNFYVTESNVHANRLFFFRHDIWRSISEPSISDLKLSMLEEIKVNDGAQTISSRSLGWSHLRLLPKIKGARPIINFKRRKLERANGSVTFAKGVNKLLEPVHNMLVYEKNSQPDRLGSSMFSQGEMYQRLKAYKAGLLTSNDRGSPLYFVKVDVKSCFDTIPQLELLKFIYQLISEEEYRMPRYTVIRPPEARFDGEPSKALKPILKWKCRAQPINDFTSFYDVVNDELASNRKKAVFVEPGNFQHHNARGLLDLLDQHVRTNVVKVNQRYYRQKRGIPQGSILSSILCNFFYADMERKKLDFLNEESLLLRHTDDFLLITTSRQHAKRFLQLMHDGHPEYGISVNATKSLVNFEVTINGMKVSRLRGGNGFPYLGDFINTRTLAVSTDSDRRKQTGEDLCTATLDMH
jgi:telomerase reverse transcriptase